MSIDLDIISDLYKKTAFVILFFSIFSYFILKSFSFSVGCFILFLNVIGIFFISVFAKRTGRIDKEKIIFCSLLFFGKLLFIISIIFVLLKFNFVSAKYFIGGLSLGFAIFFISNLIFLPVKIYKKEN